MVAEVVQDPLATLFHATHREVVVGFGGATHDEEDGDRCYDG